MINGPQWVADPTFQAVRDELQEPLGGKDGLARDVREEAYHVHHVWPAIGTAWQEFTPCASLGEEPIGCGLTRVMPVTDASALLLPYRIDCAHFLWLADLPTYLPVIAN